MTPDPLAGVSPQTELGERTSANPAEDARAGRRFKVGDRIAYKNFDGVLTPGTVTRVQKAGYRIAWDDGYKDLPGSRGVYTELELVAEGEPYA